MRVKTPTSTPAAVAPPPDYLSHALRLGLANHPRFPGAIHQRLLLDCLYEIPTQRLNARDLIAQVSAKFDGITLTAGQVRAALEGLESTGWIEVESEARTGTKRYGLSVKGVHDWEAARADGFSLEARVREAFLDEIGLDRDPETRRRAWRELVDQLEALFRREAYDVARTFLDDGRFPGFEDGRPANGADPADPAALRLSMFLRTATGDRQVFLRRLLNGALAYHLFRASPEADQAVRRHLSGRTFYLDTTVLYSLLARDGELAELRDDLVRVTQELGCRLRVTRETLHEFQESVAHYKALLLSRGVTNVEMAHALLSPQAIDDLDDFRRGYYQALLRDPKLTIDLYALRYETIEEQLPQWGIPAAIEIPTAPRQGRDGEWEQLGNVEEYATSLTDYLQQHPRRGQAEDGPQEHAIRHDATMLAWVQRERQRRGITVPTRPSQVDIWFLTRDRRLTHWDRDYVAAHGLGRVGRCLTLDDWIESIAVFVPSIRDSEAATALALRELSLTCPPIPRDEELSAEDLQEVGRAAEVFMLHPQEAARIVADRQFVADMRAASGRAARFEAIKAGVIRLKDEEIGRLKVSRETFKTAAEKAEARAKLEQLERERAQAQEKKMEVARGDLERERDALKPDAEFGRRQRQHGPLALAAGVVLTAVCFLGIASVPALWSEAGVARRALVAGTALGVVVLPVTLWLGGFRRLAAKVFGGSGIVIGIASGFTAMWKDSAHPESQPAAGRESPTPVRAGGAPGPTAPPARPARDSSPPTAMSQDSARQARRGGKRRGP